MLSRSLRILGATCALVVATSAAADEPAATKVIARLNAALLDALEHAEQLGYRGRFDKLTPAIAAAFDVDFMAEKSIGKYWKPLSDADKARWVKLFAEFSVANYAGNLDHFSGQRFEISSQEPSQNDTVVVHTMLVDPGSENTELNYRLHDTPQGPKIVDIYLKGTVSELALRRSDYTSVLEREGFDALLATVRAKIADLASGRGKRKPG
jgi:phospholipid transport system substrate-binding protein